MSMIARRTALQAARLPSRQFARPARRSYAETVANETAEKKDVLTKGAKKDPELYVCCSSRLYLKGTLGYAY